MAEQAADDGTVVHYPDRTGRSYLLPPGWEPVPGDFLDQVHRRALDALTETPPGGGTGLTDRLAAYYRTEGAYAGATFLEVEPHHDHEVTATDLWAVSTLTVEVTARVGRHLLTPGRRRTTVGRLLRALPVNRGLADLPAEAPADGGQALLDTMYDLYTEFRTADSVAGEDDRSPNWWVFAAKLAARKRPDLFPVRDRLVCQYLAGGRRVGRGPDRLGTFGRDVQVFADLISRPDVREPLARAYTDLSRTPGVLVDFPRLRLLDVALWTYARQQQEGGPGPIPDADDDAAEDEHGDAAP